MTTPAKPAPEALLLGIALKHFPNIETLERRLTFADDAGDMRPEMARIISSEPFSCDRERLARIARADNIHRAAPWAAIEGSNVVPNKRAIQGRVFHPRHERGCGEGFPLDIAHSTISGDGDSEPKVNPASAGAEREAEQARVCGSGAKSGGR